MKRILLLGWDKSAVRAICNIIALKDIAAGGTHTYSLEVIRDREGWAQVMALAKNHGVAHQSHVIHTDTIEETIDELVSRGCTIVTVGDGCCIRYDHWEFSASKGWRKVISG